MFTDIATTWNALLESIDDVKELVPELFYLPEVFLDDSGMDSEDSPTNMVPVGNVKLPPRSSNPVDFIQKHRAALESAHVADHLHEWIDLIFGPFARQHGSRYCILVKPHFSSSLLLM